LFIQRVEEGDPQIIEDSLLFPFDQPPPTRTG
jgi:hypothetical protein